MLNGESAGLLNQEGLSAQSHAKNAVAKPGLKALTTITLNQSAFAGSAVLVTASGIALNRKGALSDGRAQAH